MFLRTLLLFILPLSVISCSNTSVNTKAGTEDSLHKSIVDQQKKRAQPHSDSIAHAQFYTARIKFYRGLIDNSVLVEDTSWYQYLDNDRNMDLYDIRISNWGDDPPTSVEFPFKDIRMSYHQGRIQYYFMINGSRIPETVYTGDNTFPVCSIHRFAYKDGKYLVFGGGLRNFNGYGDRIHFNYFFDLSGKRIVANMYENYTGWMDDLFLYGDLNDDGILDRICFDGVSRPSAVSQYDTVTFSAETYQDHKWKPLADAARQPYFIKLLMEDESMEKIVAQNWMRPLPPIR